MIIKVLLVAAALGFAVLLLRERVPGQRLALRRVVGLGLALVGIVAVLFPQLTTYAANAVGVGRGTDLVLYLLVTVFVFNAVTTSQRIHQLEQQVRTLTRELALHRATDPATRARLTTPPDQPGE